MSDWQVGDLALCMDARQNPFYAPHGLVEGRAYTVSGFSEPAHSRFYRRTKLVPGLFLVEEPSEPLGFAPERFRKIRPDAHEACEAEFMTLLRKSKRRVEA